jgi:hypothetical protein
MFSSFSNSTSLSQYYKPVIVQEPFPTGQQVLKKIGIVFPATNVILSTVKVSNIAYGSYLASGNFIASSSSSYGSIYGCGVPFNNNTTAEMWVSANGTYTSAGLYSGTKSTIVSDVTTFGEWLQIQTPFSFALTFFQFFSKRNSLVKFAKTTVVAGSNDGINWDLMTTISANVYTDLNTGTTLTNNTTKYIFYRFIVKEMTYGGGEAYACIGCNPSVPKEAFLLMS